MELHERVDMGCKPIYTTFHASEASIHFLAQIADSEIDNIDSSIHPLKSPFCLSKATSNKPFERREPLIDGSSFLGGLRLCHWPK